MLSSPSLRVGQTVVKGGREYIVSELDGNVVGLRHQHGSFAMYTPVDLVHVQLELDLAPAASVRPACSVTAPAGPAVGASRPKFHAAVRLLSKPLGMWRSQVSPGYWVYLGVCCGNGYSERRA